MMNRAHPRALPVARALRAIGGALVLVGAPNVATSAMVGATTDAVVTTYSNLAALGLLAAGLGLGPVDRRPRRLAAAIALVLAGGGQLVGALLPSGGVTSGLLPALHLSFAATAVALGLLALDARGPFRLLATGGTLAALAGWALAVGQGPTDQLVLDLLAVLIGGTLLATAIEPEPAQPPPAEVALGDPAAAAARRSSNLRAEASSSTR